MVPNFRAWDKITKRYYSVETWHMEDEYVDLIESNKSTADPNAKRFWRRISEVILEQSTGLKDANDKEIYEGDIVQPVSSYVHFKLGKPFEVKKESYVYGKWTARHISDDVSVVDGYYFSNEIQIIGNVHENLELLEAQHDTRTD